MVKNKVDNVISGIVAREQDINNMVQSMKDSMGLMYNPFGDLSDLE